MFSMQSTSKNPLIATFQLLSNVVFGKRLRVYLWYQCIYSSFVVVLKDLCYEILCSEDASISWFSQTFYASYSVKELQFIVPFSDLLPEDGQNLEESETYPFGNGL